MSATEANHQCPPSPWALLTVALQEDEEAAARAVEMWKIKKLIKSLEEARG